MRFLFFVAALTGLAMLPAQAAADCGCLCVDGSYRPVCTAADELNANRGVCQAQSNQPCPAAPPGGELERYAPPQDGVANCRQAQVFDAAANEHLIANVCDVVPAS